MKTADLRAQVNVYTEEVHVYTEDANVYTETLTLADLRAQLSLATEHALSEGASQVALIRGQARSLRQHVGTLPKTKR